MIGLDTNVVVRLLVADDAAQTARARRLLVEQSAFLSRTVLLEVVWVLRATYAHGSARIVEALDALLGLDGVVIEDREDVGEAVDLAREGMDLADALHLVACPRGVAFATFDRDLVRTARRAGRGSVVRPL